MSKDTEVLRDQYRAVNERDFKRAMSHYAEDVELTIPDQAYLRSGTFRGREVVGEWFGDWFQSFDRDLSFEITELSELDDGSILLISKHRGRGRISGAEVDGTVIWIYRLEDGKIAQLYGYSSREEALAAAQRGV